MLRPRIAIVAESFPPAKGGGIAAAQQHLLRLFRAAGYEVKAFTYTAPGKVTTKAGSDAWADVVRVGIPQSLERFIHKSVRNAFRVLDRGQVAYQSADIFKSFLGGFLLNGPLKSFRPDLLILPDQGAPGLLIFPPTGCKILLVSHHNPTRFLTEPLFGSYSKLDAKLAVGLEQLVLKRVDRVICPSPYQREMFHQAYMFSGPVDVLPNLIDPTSLDRIEVNDVRTMLALPQGCPIVYIPSAGSKYKGANFVPELIFRMASLSTQQIGFYLSGSMNESQLKALSGAPQNARLFIPGALENEKHLSYVKSCSLVVSPTLIENFSMAFLEAITLGIPVVTFDVGGNSALLRDGVCGFLVPHKNVQKMAEIAARLLSPNQLSELSAQTKAYAKLHYAPERWIPEWVK